MKLPNNKLAETNEINPILEEIETNFEYVADKIEDNEESIDEIKETLDEKMNTADFPKEISVSNLPSVQKVEITNHKQEKDNSSLFNAILEELKYISSKEDFDTSNIEKLLSELTKKNTTNLEQNLDKIKEILSVLNENVTSIEIPNFDYVKLAKIIKDNLNIQVSAGGGGTPFLKNTRSEIINPATEDKQDSAITELSAIGNTSYWLKSLIRLLKPLSIVTGGGSNRLSVDVNAVTAVTTVTTVTTTTTVGTVSNQTNMGNVSGFTLQQALLRDAFANGIRKNLS